MADYYTCSIGLDLDGTIRDFIGRLNYLYDKEFPTETRSPNPYGWDLSKYYSIGNKIFDFAYNTKGYDITTWSQPYKDAIRFYNQLLKIGDVWIITNQRNAGMRAGTLQWIERYLSGYKGIIFAEDKNLKCIDVLIDDYVKNLDSFHGKTYCVKREWNVEYTGKRYTYEGIISDLSSNYNS